jgi:hypothetical protein
LNSKLSNISAAYFLSIKIGDGKLSLFGLKYFFIHLKIGKYILQNSLRKLERNFYPFAKKLETEKKPSEK